MAKFLFKKERPFASLYDDRKVQHIFPREERYILQDEYTPPLSNLRGPGDYAGGIDSQYNGPRARLQSRRQLAADSHAERTRNLGPGTYNPRLTGGRYYVGEYDESMPSCLSRTDRQTFIKPGEVGNGDYTPNMPQVPKAPGHRSFT